MQARPANMVGDASRTDGVTGARGMLRQWTMDDGRTVLRTEADFERAMDVVVASECDWLFSLLCDVQDHMGQACTAVCAVTEADGTPTIQVQFADGFVLWGWPCDIWFD